MPRFSWVTTTSTRHNEFKVTPSRQKKCVSISVSISPHNRWHILEAIKALQPRGEEGRLHFFTTVRLLLQGCGATENLFLFLRLFSSLTQIEEFGIDIQAFWNSTFYHVLNTARGAILCHVWIAACASTSNMVILLLYYQCLLHHLSSKWLVGWLTISGYSQSFS